MFRHSDPGGLVGRACDGCSFHCKHNVTGDGTAPAVIRPVRHPPVSLINTDHAVLSSVPSSFSVTMPGDSAASPCTAAAVVAGDGLLTTRCCRLASLITVDQIQTRTNPRICASSPGNEISQELASLVDHCFNGNRLVRTKTG